MRSETSLIQTIGRAARNVEGRVILYADVVTESMRRAIDETERRRKKQQEYNELHNITPASIVKEVRSNFTISRAAEREESGLTAEEKLERIELLREQMQQAARELEFETAAKLRDEMKELMGEKVAPNKKAKPGTVGAHKRSRGRSRK